MLNCKVQMSFDTLTALKGFVKDRGMIYYIYYCTWHSPSDVRLVTTHPDVNQDSPLEPGYGTSQSSPLRNTRPQVWGQDFFLFLVGSGSDTMCNNPFLPRTILSALAA